MALIQQTYAQLDPAMLQMGIKSQLSQQEAQLATLAGDERAAKARELAELKKILAATEGKPAEFKKQFIAYHSKLLKQGSDQNKNQQQKDLANAQERNVEYKNRQLFWMPTAIFGPCCGNASKTLLPFAMT